MLETGVPLMAHSFPTGHVAKRQIKIFKEEGVDLTRVKIDHCNDTTDTEYLTMDPGPRLFHRALTVILDTA